MNLGTEAVGLRAFLPRGRRGAARFRTMSAAETVVDVPLLEKHEKGPYYRFPSVCDAYGLECNSRLPVDDEARYRCVRAVHISEDPLARHNGFFCSQCWRRLAGGGCLLVRAEVYGPGVTASAAWSSEGRLDILKRCGAPHTPKPKRMATPRP